MEGLLEKVKRNTEEIVTKQKKFRCRKKVFVIQLSYQNENRAKIYN
jgi:hypothetical protein